MELPNPPRRSGLSLVVRWTFAVLILLTGVLIVLVSGIFTWSPLNCWYDDVDINSGKIRHSRYLLYVNIDETVEPSWLSEAVGSPIDEPNWKRVNTFSPGVDHSPHHTYHAAISQINMLETLDQLVPFEPDAEQYVALKVLQSWHVSKSDAEADVYIQQVSDLVMSRLKMTGAKITLNDLKKLWLTPGEPEADEPATQPTTAPAT